MASNSDRKQYNKMENVIQYINKNFVSLNDEDVKKVNPVLRFVIDEMIKNMKEVTLFKSLYSGVQYGGSFYDGFKVGKPGEFDIDIILTLPKLVDAKLIISDQPGFVFCQMPGWDTFEKSTAYEANKGLQKFKDSKNFLLFDELLKWVESIGNQVLNKYPKTPDKNKNIMEYNGKNIEISLSKGAPALTAKVCYEGINVDIDLVLCFKFTSEKWPTKPFKKLPEECKEKKDFLIVPKAPKIPDSNVIKGRYCRLSFQEQERVIINGYNNVKPALRLIKKLRDTKTQTKISSYFLKTVFLWEIEDRKSDKSFWNSPLSFIFMHMLKKYRDCMLEGKIKYFWNINNNLIDSIEAETLRNFGHFLNNIISEIDKNVDTDPYVIGRHLLTPEELQQLMDNVRI